MQWSLEHLLIGRYPDRRHDGILFSESTYPGDKIRATLAGRPLGCRGLTVKKRGDWAWMKQACGLCGWKAEGVKGNVCYKCAANCTDMVFTDPSHTALWRDTIVTRAMFLLAIQMGGACQSICNWPGFDIEVCDIDWMHCGDLGVLVYWLGNFIWHMIVELGGTFKNNKKQCGQIISMIKLAAHELDKDPPISNLSVSMVKASNGKPPKLKVKAAEARHLLPITHFMLCNYFDCRGEIGKIRVCSDNLKLCYSLLDNWFDGAGVFMAEHGRKFFLGYCELSKMALVHEAEPLHWRIYPKFHLWLHLCESGVNPKLLWNYMDESEIGRCAELAEGMHARTLSTALLNKYRVFTFKNPTYPNPTYQNPTFPNPTCQNPSYQNPTFQDPTFQNPTCQNPTCQNPTYQNPTCQNPAYQHPTYQNPTYQNPTYQNPIYQNPTYQNHTYQNMLISIIR